MVMWLYSESIGQIKDVLWFHVFDEIIEDLPPSDNTTSSSEICQKISSHYLGELMIPFSTIYASQRVSIRMELLAYCEIVHRRHLISSGVQLFVDRGNVPNDDAVDSVGLHKANG